MTSTLLNALETLLPAVITLLYAALIGLGVQAAVAGYVRFPRSLGITAGIGLSLTALLMVYSYRLLENVSLPIIPLAAAALLSIGVRIYLDRSKGASRAADLRMTLLKGMRFATSDEALRELFPALLTVIVLYPVLGYGLTSWTRGIVDLPNYASSAEIWMNSAEIFSQKHQDIFGDLQLWRAAFEKPTVTAIMSLTSILTAYPPYQLLSPTLAILLFIGLSSLLILTRVIFKVGSLTASLVISLPTFSIVPISRVYDGQPGQVASVAILSCLLAVLATPAYRKGVIGKLLIAALAAVVGTAALGTNFTLVAGSSVMLGATFLWALSRKPQQFHKVWQSAAFGFVATLVLSVPMARMYLVSISFQTEQTDEYNVPFASPLALIGQQVSLSDVASQNQVLLSWCLIIATMLVAIWARPSGRFRWLFDLILLSGTIINALVIALRFGWPNYSTHKWLGLFIAFAVPLLLAYGVSLFRGRDRIAMVMLLIPLAVTSAYIGTRRGLEIQNVVSNDMLELKNNEYLKNQKIINIRLGDIQENSIAALVMPSQRVVVAERTYAHASLPERGPFLLRTTNREYIEHPGDRRLNDTYILNEKILHIDANHIDFTSNFPESRRFLFGLWFKAEEWGTWAGTYSTHPSSGTQDNHVVFIVPNDYRSDDLDLTVTGNPYEPEGTNQTVEFLVNGELLPHHRDNRTWTIKVPHRLVAAEDGWIALTIRVGQPFSPSQFGSGDRRILSFGLSQLRFSTPK